MIYNPALIGYATNLVCDRLHLQPTVAYSIRQLFSEYHGPAMIVRRSSDNTSTTINYKNGFLDTTTLLSFCGSGNGFISTWYNQGLNGTASNAIQAATGSQAQIVATGALTTQNAISSVLFNGAYSYTATVSNLASGNATSYMSLVASYSSTGANLEFAGHGPSGALIQRLMSTGNGSVWAADIDSVQAHASSSTINKLYAVGGVFTSTNIQLYQNGVVATTATTQMNTTAATTLYIGYNPVANAAQGHMSEFLNFNGYISSDRQILEIDQGKFYGIAGVT